MTWTFITTLVRAVPSWAWRLLGGVAVLAAIVGSLKAGYNAIRRAERTAVLAEAAAVDQITLRWQRDALQRQVDSVRVVADRLRDSVEVRVRVVNRWTPLIPDSLRKKYAAVDSLVRACTRLAQDCDSLRIATARIDTLTDTVRILDSTRVRALTLGIVQRDGRILELEARTCRVPTGIGSAIGALVGYHIRRSR